MANSLMIGLIPAMTIVAFVLSILAYTRHNKFYVVDKNGNQVTVRNWHNSDDGKQFMTTYMNNLGYSKFPMELGKEYFREDRGPNIVRFSVY